MGSIGVWICCFLAASLLLSVSADGVIGAVTPARVPELCAACSAGCRTISGLFTRPQLPPGYSLVTQIPKGACRLFVSQLKQTRNHIAIRYPNGTYIVNGEHEVGKHREKEAAGTRFAYRRQDLSNMESVSAPGPLSTPIDIMIIYSQPNPGIKYEFMLPVDQPLEHVAPPAVEPKRPAVPETAAEPRRLDRPFVTLSQGDEAKPTRRRRRKFLWKVVGMTACSKTCGGGVQHPQVACVREHNHAPVLERRCAHLDKPRNHTIRCGGQPCPARWSGTWSACSATCGPGEQTRVLECLQEVSTSLTISVKENLCNEPRPPTHRKCEISPCDPQDNELEQELPSYVAWSTSAWSQCSVSCGTGQRTRLVSCSGKCRPEERPSQSELCHGPPCPPSSQSQTGISPWLVTDWTEHCSVECGTGTQSRWATCPATDCDARSKPETSRACSSERQCGGSWYTGPWGPCSDSCNGSARQKREVNGREVVEKLCEGTCPPRWHTGEWAACDGHCSTGAHRREVRCLDQSGRYATGCPGDVPPMKKTCQCAGPSSKTDYSSRESSQAQDEPSPDRACSDSFSNCLLVVQARLCQYPYYRTSCCNSCRKHHYEPRE